jgi:hypothetical protein
VLKAADYAKYTLQALQYSDLQYLQGCHLYVMKAVHFVVLYELLRSNRYADKMLYHAYVFITDFPGWLKAKKKVWRAQRGSSNAKRTPQTTAAAAVQQPDEQEQQLSDQHPHEQQQLQYDDEHYDEQQPPPQQQFDEQLQYDLQQQQLQQQEHYAQQQQQQQQQQHTQIAAV